MSRNLIPYVIDWPPSEQQQLVLTEEEEKVFEKHGPPRKFAVKMGQKLPTALHSWGGQAQGCACGCRQTGFSSQLLKKRGLFAQLFPVVDAKPGECRWRHLHVKEVSLLNGLPPLLSWGQDQRLNLAAAGQMASPLQAAWVGALTIKQIFTSLDRLDWKDPAECVNNLKQLVMEQTRALFPRMVASPTNEISLVRLWFDHDSETVLDIKVDPTATVHHLREAETQLNGLSVDEYQFEDGIDGSILDPDTKVAGLSVRVARSQKRTPLLSQVLPLALQPSDVPIEEAKSIVVDPISTEAQVEKKTAGSSSAVHVTKVLPSSHLTDLVPPQVTDVKTCSTFRAQQTFVQDRLDVLYGQGGIMGDDEIIWHLQQAVSNDSLVRP